MYRMLMVMTFITQLAVARNPIRNISAASLPQQNQSGPAAVLCLPGIYTYDPGDCLPAGPSAYLSRLAEKGITLPLPPLSYTKIDPTLGNVEVHYGEVRNMPAPVFSSVDDAVNNNRKSAADRLNGNFVFISYTNEQEAGGKKLYEIGPNAWMTGNYITRLGVIPPSLGITFNNTPTTAFGWVLTYFSQTPQVETKRTPGLETPDYTGRLLNLFDMVQVFATEQVNDEPWYMIGPDEWIQGKFVARVIPNPTPPAGVTGDRWIEVNLFDQTLAVYDQRRLVYATVIASGADPFWTRPGVFQIYEKHDTTPMTGSFESDRSDAYYLEDVPWTMYFDKARALHGAYWRAKMGFEQSHGCVNMTVGDAHWLYNWGQIGDWVYVWDPSGKTPTDETLYQSGGY
jgi:L,D-transpeptidase catalytic domain